MKKIVFWIFIFSFFLLRPFELQQKGMFYPTDDYGYFAHASAMVFGQFPSYEKEYFMRPTRTPLTGIGPAIMASPFVFVFSLIDRVSGADIVKQRAAENIIHSWSLFGFIMASQFYFILGCFLLYWGVCFYTSRRYAVLSVVFMALCQGMPIYVFRRPINSHSFEFFLQSLFVFFSLKYYNPREIKPPGYLFSFGLGIIAGLMVLTRYNNIALAAVWPFIILCARLTDLKRRNFWARISAAGVGAGVMIFLFMILPNVYIPSSRIARVGDALLQSAGPIFFMRRILHILDGIDWGLLYTAPFILIGLFAAILLRFPLKKRLLICLLAMAINLYVAIMWRTQGGYYAYRFLFPSAIPLLIYPLALGLERLETIVGRHARKIWLLIAAFPVLSMLCFLGNGDNLGFWSAEQYFGVPGPGNNTFQMEIWEMLLFTPGQLILVLIQGGIFYLIHVFCVMFECVRALPNAVYVRYPVFSGLIFLKICMMYAWPFLLYWLFKQRGPSR